MEKLEDYGFKILEVVSGSHSNGINLGTDLMGNPIPEELEKLTKEGLKPSDFDTRGIFIPHRKFLLGLQANEKKRIKYDQFDDPEQEDSVFLSIKKFTNLGLECNPNVVEQLFVRKEHILFANELGLELLALGPKFISKNAYSRYCGYALEQLKRMDPTGTHSGRGMGRYNPENSHAYLVKKFGIDTKAFGHNLRLSFQGIQILKEGKLDTYLPEPYRTYVMRVRRYGLHPFKDEPLTAESAHEIAESLYEQMQEALIHSTIPDVPDYDAVNKWVVSATDRAHHLMSGKGVFQGVSFNVLPLEYEMIDKCTVFLVSNPLVRKKSKSEARGVAIPYKDWFIGLREFKEFRFQETLIDSFHKFSRRVIDGNPASLDVLFAGDEHVLYQHPLANEMKELLKTSITSKPVYNTARGYVMGKFKEMNHWEEMKSRWENEKSQMEKAKQKSSEDWEDDFEKLSSRRLELGEEKYFEEKQQLTNSKEEWHALVNKTPLTPYPPVPKGTDVENSSLMQRHGYDTLLASEMIHVLRNAIELLSTGRILDSRAYEPELYSVKHGLYKDFESFKDHANTLLAELEEAHKNSVLPIILDSNFDFRCVSFIEKWHEQLD